MSPAESPRPAHSMQVLSCCPDGRSIRSGRQSWRGLGALSHRGCWPPPDRCGARYPSHGASPRRFRPLPIASRSRRSTHGGGRYSADPSRDGESTGWRFLCLCGGGRVQGGPDLDLLRLDLVTSTLPIGPGGGFAEWGRQARPPKFTPATGCATRHAAVYISLLPTRNSGISRHGDISLDIGRVDGIIGP